MFNNSSNNEVVRKPMAFMYRITCICTFVIRIHRTRHSACLSEVLISFPITRPEQEGGGRNKKISLDKFKSKIK